MISVKDLVYDYVYDDGVWDECDVPVRERVRVGTATGEVLRVMNGIWDEFDIRVGSLSWRGLR